MTKAYQVLQAGPRSEHGEREIYIHIYICVCMGVVHHAKTGMEDEDNQECEGICVQRSTAEKYSTDFLDVA